jgi:fatty acid desaturase
MENFINIAHFCATWGMFGVIWFVQIVHYPLLAKVGVKEFPEFEKTLTFRTSFIVIPLMVAEITTAFLLLLLNYGSEVQTLLVLNFAAVLLIWISTFFIQVPLHNRLLLGFDKKAHSKLVTSNWLRTILWTTRGVTSLLILIRLEF